jgi:nicotinate-nucleotide adenylyltransferase
VARRNSESPAAAPETLTRPDARLPPFYSGMRVGLFGGTFDPPHAGHVEVSRVALRTLGLNQVWWLVSPHNPLKPRAPADLARRIHAARRIARDPRIKVTGIEATLGTRYTAETLALLLPRLRGVDLVWMMGADNLTYFHRWRDWKAIAASVPIAVFNRPESALPALSGPTAHALWRFRYDASDAAALPGSRPPAWVFLPSPHVNLSSTALRAAFKTS